MTRAKNQDRVRRTKDGVYATLPLPSQNRNSGRTLELGEEKKKQKQTQK